MSRLAEPEGPSVEIVVVAATSAALSLAALAASVLLARRQGDLEAVEEVLARRQADLQAGSPPSRGRGGPRRRRPGGGPA